MRCVFGRKKSLLSRDSIEIFICSFFNLPPRVTDTMNTALLLIAIVFSLVFASQGFQTNRLFTRASSAVAANKIAEGVEFNTIAREWRFKWSPDDEKRSLVSAQATLGIFAPSLKKLEGVKSVQRIVCGGCHDFKVIVALNSDKFAAWVSYFPLQRSL